jgi:ubiquinone/menaquinone biosynthesis C-methylase UbiE
VKPEGSYGAVAKKDADLEAERLRQQVVRLWHRERSLLRKLGLTSGATILDVGCGSGALMAGLLRDFSPKRLVGVDVSDEHLRRARAVTTTVARGEATALPFADEQFDFVVFRLVLRHLRSPGDAVREARRVLRAGGRLLLIDADDSALVLDPEPRDWASLKLALDHSARRRGADPFIGRRLRRLLADADLLNLRCTVLPVTTDDVSPNAFVEVFMAPAARPLDTDLMDAKAANVAWSDVRQWAERADAFGCAFGYFASGRKP